MENQETVTNTDSLVVEDIYTMELTYKATSIYLFGVLFGFLLITTFMKGWGND